MATGDRLIWPQAKALEEAELIRRGRHADPRQRKGLAISGGGIRSATFALGVLEALKANDKLHDVAYLAGQTYLEPHPRELMLRNHV